MTTETTMPPERTDEAQERVAVRCSALVRRLRNHIAQMAGHQKTREAGRLLIEASKELEKFEILRVRLQDCAAYLSYHGPIGSTPDTAKLLLQDVQRALSPNEPS